MRVGKIWGATFIALTASAAAFEAAAGPVGYQDWVSFTLTQEGWVQTESARVIATVDLQPDLKDSARSKEEVKEALARLTADVEVDWKIVGFQQWKESTDLDRWQVVAEGRVPEKVTAGLADRANEASKPGFKVTVSQISFEPTVAEREAALRALREKIYVAAQTERDRLNLAHPGKTYRVHSMNFLPRGQFAPHLRRQEMAMDAQPQMMMAKSAPVAASAAEGGQSPAASGLPIAEKISLTATVVLAFRPSPRSVEAPGPGADKPLPPPELTKPVE